MNPEEDLQKEVEKLKSVDTQTMSIEQLSSFIEDIAKIIERGEERLSKLNIEDESTIHGPSL